MVHRDTFPRVLLLLAALVFFSANTVYFLEDDGRATLASVDRSYHFNFDHVRENAPRLNAESVILVNYDNGEVVYTKNADLIRSIASISKLVTAMVVIDKGIDLTQTERITKDDAYRSSRSRLSVGYELTLLDLLYGSLMNSDNRATRALVRAVAPSMESFVQDMNVKVKELGLENTVFYDPTGLDSRNVSTAHEVAKIVHYAYEYGLIREITSQKAHRARILNRANTFRRMTNTNLFVNSPYKVLSGKTGYITAADHCLATLIRNEAGERLTLVVLGAPGSKTRFREARKLARWGFEQV